VAHLLLNEHGLDPVPYADRHGVDVGVRANVTDDREQPRGSESALAVHSDLLEEPSLVVDARRRRGCSRDGPPRSSGGTVLIRAEMPKRSSSRVTSSTSRRLVEV
jgi:hypothetical protein